jgi:hypothetical protein
MARFGSIPTELDVPSSNFLRRNAGDTAFEAAADVVIDGDFASQGIMLRGAGAGSYSIMTGSAAVDTVEGTLTNDATHMPTSAAVYAAILGGLSYWDRTGTILHPGTSGDDVQIDGGTLTVNTINEFGGGVGVTIEGTLLIDSNIGGASLYQGSAFMTQYNQRMEGASTSNKAYLYSSTSGHAHQNYTYRYGGTIAVPVAVASNTYMNHYRGYVHDGTTTREITRYSVKVDGAVATDNVAGEHHWLLRPSGVSAGLVNYMELDQLGLHVNVISELTSTLGVTIELVELKDGGITLATGATVNEIETILTNDDTHLPTSGAVYDGIADSITTYGGAQYYVPYTNLATDDFDYHSSFKYEANVLYAANATISGIAAASTAEVVTASSTGVLATSSNFTFTGSVLALTGSQTISNGLNILGGTFSLPTGATVK